jgi:hypothetical protein
VKLPDPTKKFDLGELKTSEAANTELQWSELTETEKSAASLGVSPDEWKPLTFLNEGHYNELLKTNSVGDELAKRLEAYKVVSLGGK